MRKNREKRKSGRIGTRREEKVAVVRYESTTDDPRETPVFSFP